MDPNKYVKNANIRPESLSRTMLSTASFVLMVIGIIGIALDAFKADGLIKQALFFLFQSTQTMLLIPVILLSFWLLNRWISSPNKAQTKRSGNLPMYIMMLLGVYYVFQFLTTGGF
jgi:hypothetical protein